MSFATRLALAGIFVILFTVGFSYYLVLHPWPSATLEMYPCFLVIGLAWLFVAAADK